MLGNGKAEIRLIVTLLSAAVLSLMAIHAIAEERGVSISKQKELEQAAASEKLKAWQQNYFKTYGKIKDPYHPWFEPDQFRFEDYTGSRCMMKEAMAKLFPPGTPKAFVDRVLVSAGGAHANPNSNQKNKFNYIYDVKPGPLVFMSHTWNIGISFDQDNKVFDIRFPEGRPPGASAYDFFSYCQFGKHYGENWGD